MLPLRTICKITLWVIDTTHFYVPHMMPYVNHLIAR